MTYGETIKQAREALHMTQEQLAEALDISRQAVSKWEADLSRPTRSKLERLSEVLEIPAETWAALDAELAAAAQPPDRTRLWKIAMAILGTVCLALTLALAAALWRQSHPSTLVPSETAQADDGSVQVTGLSEVFPDTLSLSASHDFNFGDEPVGEYDPALVPFLDDPLRIEDESLWSRSFESGERSVWLNVVKTNPQFQNGTAFYDIYLLYAVPDSAGRLDWKILTRLADENCYLDTFSAEPFSNVLGYEGWKLSIVVGASAGSLDYYFIQRPDGTPCLMTTGSNAREFDADEDGVLEIVSVVDEVPFFCEITDTEEGQEGAFHYLLNPSGDGFSNVKLSFAPEKGGLVVTDSHDAVLVRYILRDRALVRLSVTDFSVQDYPDVIGTEIEFITEGLGILSDGRDPDDVLYSGGNRITHRQQAYLALQELYDLTGLRLDFCYCAASESGVLFSLLPDGFDQRSFFTAYFSEAYGGYGIPNLRIAWKELGSDWSPLSLEAAVLPGPEVPPENMLCWYYDRLEIFRTGEAALETDGSFPEERYLYLEDGSLFVGSFQDTEWGVVLESLLGPYPDGIVNH